MRLTDIKTAIRKSAGITELNPMQAAVAASDARRIVLLSPTGSGKTLAFATAVLRRISPADAASAALHAVIIAPSRELVRQIHDVLRPIASTFRLKTVALYGGNSFSSEEASIAGAIPSIVVATPGRLLDHINRGTLDVSDVGIAVLDEYDKTLELGFHDEMKRISARLSHSLPGGKPRFVMVTSATRLTDVPAFVDIAKAEIIDFTPDTSDNTKLRIVNVPSPDRDKLATLAALIRALPANGPIIVFVNHRESADRVGNFLEREHISSVVYHGGLDQQQREIALARFDSRAARVLVATDLAGCGIDVEGVQAVIHYHPAGDKEIWTHRNGRTARVDRTGEVYVITSPDENLPDFVVTENDYYPDMTATGAVTAEMTLIYFDRGKRDKISRGDIAGFIMKQAGVPADAVGKITVGARYSLAAVRHGYADAVIAAAKATKLKNLRTRASLA